MRVLVTGARGYIGSRLVPALLERGHEVVATSSDGTGTTAYPWRDDVEWRAMDVFDPEQVRAAVEGIDVLVYLIHGLDDRDYVSRDAIAAANVAQAVDEDVALRIEATDEGAVAGRVAAFAGTEGDARHHAQRILQVGRTGFGDQLLRHDRH